MGSQYVLQGGNLVKNRMAKASQVSDVAHGPLVQFCHRLIWEGWHSSICVCPINNMRVFRTYRPNYHLVQRWKRRNNVLHTRLRHNCALNIDLYRCNIISSPSCSCGKVEDTIIFALVLTILRPGRNFSTSFWDSIRFTLLIPIRYCGAILL